MLVGCRDVKEEEYSDHVMTLISGTPMVYGLLRNAGFLMPLQLSCVILCCRRQIVNK